MENEKTNAVIELIKYLKLETDLEFNLKTISPNQELDNGEVILNILGIEDGAYGMAIMRDNDPDSSTYKNVIEIAIMYGKGNGKLEGAESICENLKKVIPQISVHTKDATEIQRKNKFSK
jgi:hypothetical protein